MGSAMCTPYFLLTLAHNWTQVNQVHLNAICLGPKQKTPNEYAFSGKQRIGWIILLLIVLAHTVQKLCLLGL